MSSGGERKQKPNKAKDRRKSRLNYRFNLLIVRKKAGVKRGRRIRILQIFVVKSQNKCMVPD